MKRKNTTTGKNGKTLQKKVKTSVVSVVPDDVDVSDVIDDEISGPATGDDDGSLHRAVDLLSKQVSSLQSTVVTMRSQIDFLLSVLGWTSLPSGGSGSLEGGLSGASVGAAGGDGAAVTTDDAAAVDPASSWTEVAKRPAKARKALRDAVVAAVYSDQQRRDNRAANLVVTGLLPAPGTDDKQLVGELLHYELGAAVTVAHCKRLGQQGVGSKPRPLLTVLQSGDEADLIMARAKNLRQSSNPAARTVYINRHMTPAQSRAAFEERCRRRAAAQRRSESSATPVGAAPLSGPSAAPVASTSGGPSVVVGGGGLCPSAAPFRPFATPSAAATTVSALSTATVQPATAPSVSAPASSAPVAGAASQPVAGTSEASA